MAGSNPSIQFKEARSFGRGAGLFTSYPTSAGKIKGWNGKGRLPYDIAPWNNHALVLGSVEKSAYSCFGTLEEGGRSPW